MNRIALVALISSLAAAHTARPQDDNYGKNRGRGNVSAPQVKSVARVQPPPRNAQIAARNFSPNNAQTAMRRSQTFQPTLNRSVQPKVYPTVRRQVTTTTTTQQQIPAITSGPATVTTQPQISPGTAGNRSRGNQHIGNAEWRRENPDWQTRNNTIGGRQVTSTRSGNSNDHNWSGNRNGTGGHNWGGQHNWHRGHHDRSWWTSRYSRFALFGGGYYYWNSGYWYPAYGYDPYFSTYTYDAPIYSYNDLDPGQVIANVQAELQNRGYNPGGVDGTYGPMTRRALLRYQTDNGLPATGEIDRDTLGSLGLQ